MLSSLHLILSSYSDKIHTIYDNIIVSGTSASAPVVAAMVSLINSARLDAGLSCHTLYEFDHHKTTILDVGNSTLGWLNPSLYRLSEEFINDIIEGDNRCKVFAVSYLLSYIVLI